jgi:hypothetical protein
VHISTVPYDFIERFLTNDWNNFVVTITIQLLRVTFLLTYSIFTVYCLHDAYLLMSSKYGEISFILYIWLITLDISTKSINNLVINPNIWEEV